MIIPEKQYKQIINSTVNLCVDVCLRYNDKVLLIKRTEEPCKGVFWPVGGRIHKGEKAVEAARRKIKEEIGIDFKGDLYPMGFYEDRYKENSFSKNTDYCTLSIVFAGDLEGLPNIVLDKTSEEIGFFNELPSRFKVQTFANDFAIEGWV
jgi:colanic acid biosynthesis protein WcaH